VQVYRELVPLERKYLCIVATSVPSERVFSKTGQLISAKRNRLAAKTIKMVMFLMRITRTFITCKFQCIWVNSGRNICRFIVYSLCRPILWFYILIFYFITCRRLLPVNNIC